MPIHKVEADKLEEVLNVLKAIANPNRLAALCIMLEDEISVNDLAEALHINQTALSQHLKILKEKELVSVRRDHRTLYYKTTDEKLKQLILALKNIYCD